MKKIILIALVTVVVVGGALARIIVEDQFGNQMDCDDGNTLCANFPGGL